MRASYQQFLTAQLLLTAVATSNAFVVTNPSRITTQKQHEGVTSRPCARPIASSSMSSSTSLSASSAQSNEVSLEQIADVAFAVTVNKPMGVIFGENPQPFSGLVVDDVSPGLNGGAAGLRVGDQLVAVNGQVVIGPDFDAVMSLLQNSPDPLQLNLFRGSATELYTIIDNRGGLRREEPEEVVVIDENYEAPRVVFEDAAAGEEEPLTAGDVFNVFKKIGSEVAGDMKDATAAGSKEGEEGKKKGLFGGMFGGDTIQLDGIDASSLK